MLTRPTIEAIYAKSGPDGVVEVIEPIRNFSRESDTPGVRRPELKVVLSDLQQDFLIDIRQGTGKGANTSTGCCCVHCSTIGTGITG
jgi:hypothetical protein